MRVFSIVWVVALMIFIFMGTALVPFHGDEATQIYMSRDYAYQFQARDLSLIQFQEPPVSAQEQALRLLNGTVNKYFIGLAWHVSGFAITDLNEQWDWGAEWDYNVATNHMPATALLHVSRIPSALLMAFGVIPLFWIGVSAGGWTGGFVATGVYALHPALLVNGRRAMMEGSMMATSLFTVAAGIWFMRRRSLMAALSVGAAAGLALASKHTSVFTVGIVVGVCAIYTLWLMYRRRESVKLIAYGALSIAVMLILFLMLNPAWWSDPAARLSDVLSARTTLLDLQTNMFGAYTTFNERVTGLFRSTFVGTPQYFEVPAWATYPVSTAQISAYDSSVMRGFSWFDSTVGGVVLVVLTILGAVALLIDKKRLFMVRALIVMWALGTIVITFGLTPLAWHRYYVPAILGMIVLVSVGVSTMTRSILARGKVSHLPPTVEALT